MIGFIKNLKSALVEYRDAPWREVTVDKREFSWRILANHWTRFCKIASDQRVLEIQSDDQNFYIQIGINESSTTTYFGALVIVGSEFPAIPELPKNRRIRLPGSNCPPYGMIHDAIIQSIIQRCLFAERKFSKSKSVDQNGFPELTLAQLGRLTKIMSLPVAKHTADGEITIG